MTSFNLAVCIGQSLLWPQSGDLTDVDPTGHADARENVPRFVEFLIENCLEIFGCPPGDVVGTEDGMRRRCQSTVTESSTDSDSMHSMLTSHERPCHLSESMIVAADPKIEQFLSILDSLFLTFSSIPAKGFISRHIKPCEAQCE